MIAENHIAMTPPKTMAVRFSNTFKKVLLCFTSIAGIGGRTLGVRIGF